MDQFWDERYKVTNYVYGISPNLFFKENIDRLTPGKLLLPAEGEGRNANYAAKSGWIVSAYDYSSVAQKKALKLASENNVSIDYQLASHEDFSAMPESFDCLALIYVHLPKNIRNTIHQKLVSFVKPGGTIILEAFSKEQLLLNSGGPKDPDLLYTLDDLNEDFKQLYSLKTEYQTILLEEGSLHHGEAHVVRLIGKK
jgi:hypothetical protein